jgi:oligosaccharyltransferase complex subunit beta
MRVWALLVLATIVLSAAQALEKDHILVLTGNGAIQHSHSKYFSILQERGYKLTFSSTDNPSQSLSEYGRYLYDHLIIFAPHIDEFSGMIETHSITDFIDSGRSVLIAADDGVSVAIRDLASKVGVEFPDKNRVVDHFYHDISGSEHENLIVDTLPGMEAVLGTDKITNILFEGTSQSLTASRVSSGLLFPIVNAQATAYPAPRANLVAAMQARNNARVVVSGSLALFSNDFLDALVSPNTATSDGKKVQSGNRKFVTELAAWNFGERSILRASEIKHHLVGETVAPAVYTIKDNVTVSVTIEEYAGGKWVPFQATGLQLEFIMLDPYYRLDLPHTGNGVHSLTFTLPDVYGVFTFEIDYKKFGYSHLLVSQIHPVRPYKHNQYERFLEAAYPYYAGAFSMLVGIVILGLLVLYQK